MQHRTWTPLQTAGIYFLIFFALMLGYRLYDALLVKHVAFEFDLMQNLGAPAFAALAGYVTAVFGRQ